MVIVCRSPVVIHNLTPNSDKLYSVNNPFLYCGPAGFSEVNVELPKNQVYVRLDMPGAVGNRHYYIPDDEEKRTVVVEAHEPKVWELDDDLRSYSTAYGLACTCCQITDAEVDVQNGMLRMLLSRFDIDDAGSAAGPQQNPAPFDWSGAEIEENPYVEKGSKAPFEAKETNEGLYVRIDMPGVAEEDSKVWLRDGELRFCGKANRCYFEDGDRLYRGAIVLSSLSSFKAGKKIKWRSEMKNGVLRILVPPVTKGV